MCKEDITCSLLMSFLFFCHFLIMFFQAGGHPAQTDTLHDLSMLAVTCWSFVSKQSVELWTFCSLSSMSRRNPAAGNFPKVHYVWDILAHSQVIYKWAPISTVSCSFSPQDFPLSHLIHGSLFTVCCNFIHLTLLFIFFASASYCSSLQIFPCEDLFVVVVVLQNCVQSKWCSWCEVIIFLL